MWNANQNKTQNHNKTKITEPLFLAICYVKNFIIEITMALLWKFSIWLVLRYINGNRIKFGRSFTWPELWKKRYRTLQCEDKIINKLEKSYIQKSEFWRDVNFLSMIMRMKLRVIMRIILGQCVNSLYVAWGSQPVNQFTSIFWLYSTGQSNAKRK